MATPSWLLNLSLLFICVAAVFSKETMSLSRNERDSMSNSPALHHKTHKRSAQLLDPEDAGLEPEDIQDGADLFDSPYDDLNKRGTLFRFGKRGSLFRFGKRGGSLFRFGKRGGTLFRFGRSGPSVSEPVLKRNSLFRFGKRADNSAILAALQGYEGLPSYAEVDDVDSKRSVSGFHWGDAEK